MCEDCTRLHEQLQKQAGEMFGLKKNINRLRSSLKKERREKANMQKEKDQQHLRKGRKRSRFGRI